MTPEETREADIKRLEQHVAQLMEHFDTVTIVTTKFYPEPGETVYVHKGCGNWFARFGVLQWLADLMLHSKDEPDMESGE